MNKKGKILLMTPNLKGMKKGVNRIQPPLGPMIAANVMRQYGHEVFMHDTALEDWGNQRPLDDGRGVSIGQSDEDIEIAIRRYKPDVVGISALFSNLMDSAHNIARIVKKVNPEIKVVLGGNHVSNAASDYLYACDTPDSNMPRRFLDMEDGNINYAMRGEVDFEWPRLADALIKGKDISGIEGLVTRNHINPKPETLDITTLPKPARDLVNMDGYFKIGAFHSAKSMSDKVLNIMASRGCPEQCSFCTTPEMWGQKVRWRNIDDIVEEINNAIRDYNVGEIQWEDDSLTANKSRLETLCNELEKIGLPWCTPNGTKINYHQESGFKEGGKQLKMYKRMADSGCYQISLACESADQNILDEVVKKNLRVESIRPAIANAKNAGLIAHTFWIVGYPGETYEQIEKTLNFAGNSGADSYSIAILNPLPGTPIYRKVMRENLWWPGRDGSQMMFRNSLIKVDGFSNPEEFERFVEEYSRKLNRMAYERNPDKHEGRMRLESLREGYHQT